jgi:hypothetical protein
MREMRLHLLLILVVVMLGSCSSKTATTQGKKVVFSGFLDDYSILREGGKGEPLFVYKNPKVDLAAYNKILLDPIAFLPGPQSKLEKIPSGDLLLLANRIYTYLETELSKDYKIVREPAPGAMRVQVAITNLERPRDLRFSRDASIEGKLTDSLTAYLLMAAVDSRMVNSSFKGSKDYWDDTDRIFKFWVDRFTYKLCKERGVASCIPPQK